MPAITPSAKQATLRVVENLDDEATFEDIMYELPVLQKIERGQQDIEKGRTTSHSDVKDELEQWLK